MILYGAEVALPIMESHFGLVTLLLAFHLACKGSWLKISLEREHGLKYDFKDYVNHLHLMRAKFLLLSIYH